MKVKTKAYGYKLDFNNFNYRNNNEYKIALLDNEILEKMYSQHKEEIDEEKYNILKSKIDNKHCEAYVALSKDNNVCGFLNLAYKDMEDTCLNTNVKVEDKTVYIFDGYTFERYRQKGVIKCLSDDVLKILKDRGYSYAIVNIIEGTIASEKEALKKGFEKYIRYDYYHIGFIKRTYKKAIVV